MIIGSIKRCHHDFSFKKTLCPGDTDASADMRGRNLYKLANGSLRAALFLVIYFLKLFCKHLLAEVEIIY